MRLHFTYGLFLILTSTISFCQDLIVKKDSSKIFAKVYQINSTEIEYSEYNDPKKIKLKISKSEVSKITFRNGTEFICNPITNLNKADTLLIMHVKKKRKVLDTLKIGDYIKFNLQVGAVVNNSYCNIIRRQGTPSHGLTAEYYPTNDKKYNGNLNIGFNFLLGAHSYVKHLLGVNYLRSKGEFSYYSEDNPFASGSQSEQLHYISKIDFINLTTGLRLKITKRFHIEPLISFNFLTRFDVRYSGTVITRNGNRYQTIYYDNERIVGRERIEITHTISLNPRICYDLDFTNQKIELYASYNLAYKYRLPWWTIGICYYPFKKLR